VGTVRGLRAVLIEALAKAGLKVAPALSAKQRCLRRLVQSVKKVCEVPFRPNGKKPVFCKDCFASSKGDAPARPFSRDLFRAEAPRPTHRAESTPRQDDVKAEIIKLGIKLDTLIGLMQTLATVPAKAAPKTVKPKKKAAK
jgi:CxxC-x17-CxxC domain-containing protein